MHTYISSAFCIFHKKKIAQVSSRDEKTADGATHTKSLHLGGEAKGWYRFRASLIYKGSSQTLRLQE